MLLVRANKSTLNALANYETTTNAAEAKCIVVEVPEYFDVFSDLPSGVPVLVITTGMLSLAQWKQLQQIKDSKIVDQDALISEVQRILPLEETLFEDDLDDLPEDNTESVSIAKDAGKHQEFNDNDNSQDNISNETLNNNETDTMAKQLTHESWNISQPIEAYVGISFSAVGGVGKTFTCLNLGTCAAIEGIETAVIDLDLRSSELDFASGLVDPVNRRKIVDRKAKVPSDGWVTVGNWRGFPEEKLKENILRHSSGLYVVPCYPTVNTDIAEHEIKDLITVLAEHFDFIMIDGGLDFTQPHIKAALDIADVIYLVGDQEVKTIGKVSNFLTYANAELIEKSKLLINMVTPTGYFSPDEVASKLGYKNYDSISMDKQGVNTARRSRRAAVQIPGCEASNAMWKIAAKHLPFDIPENSPVKENLFSKIKKLFCFKGGVKVQ